MGKMSKYELTLVKTYVSDWGVVEGMRELFQNACDQEIVDTTNKMFYKYDEDNEVFQIGNLKSVLEVKSLLLGMSTKKDNEETTGRHGDGLKSGILALIRDGKEVVIYNYGKKQVWKPRFVNSRRYGEEILTFFVEEQNIWNPVPHNNLVIEIKGIDSEEYKEIKKTNLHIERPDDFIETPSGNILLDKEYAGKVFVNGLYVCRADEFMYGYDLKPKYIKLDRDRRAVSNWDLKLITRQMWLAQGDDQNYRIRAMAKVNSMDISGMEYVSKTNMTETYTDSYEEFVEEYGDNAMPASYSDYNEVKEQYPDAEIVSVNESVKELITRSAAYQIKSTTLRVEIVKTSETLENWRGELYDLLEGTSYELSSEMESRMDDILEKVKEME
jgi:hypothetical protein